MEIAVSVYEAAKRAGVGRTSLYEAIGRGDLKVKKNGRRSLVMLEDLRAWISALPELKNSQSE